MTPDARKILVVDDDSLIAMLITDMLEDLGCQVVGPALDLEEALAFARDCELDGAFLDLNLVGHPSFAVADVLRARNIPFVFASGYGSFDHGGKFDDVHVIQKPFEMSAFASALQHIAPGPTIRSTAVRP